MAVQPLTLNVPEPLYARLKQRAEQASRSVEDETLDFLAEALPEADELPAGLAEAASQLTVLDDEALWQAARNRLASELSVRLEELHLKRQREGLSEVEAGMLASLMPQYERAMLVRARAAALLHQRGHSVADLIAPP
jgi:plasmid stability protein